MSFTEIRDYYINKINGISPSNPFTRKQILLSFHPDKLPQNIKEYAEKNKNVGVFVSRVFDTLFKHGQLTNSLQLETILLANKAKFDSPLQPQPKPAARQVPGPAPRAAPKPKKESCVNLSHIKKYRMRKSPPYPAQACQHLVKIGNDGNRYKSLPDKNGVYRWLKYNSYV